ncbi:hypothetical protein NARC_10090 [Candidatus Nitrosocosmicus arcticus]|uniref:Uncharacterized protein n=1 Tax=Candidatus Nitrosocosmicus arcticus TaxID=2035267 RepID=A0A557SYK2_9ARCH|nr:hypothetical protein NARC_10090 [Candidatus Nitrosocosmicus arcticus]
MFAEAHNIYKDLLVAMNISLRFEYQSDSGQQLQTHLKL